MKRTQGSSALARAAVTAWHAFLDAVYPPLCFLCGDSALDGVACAAHSFGEGLAGARCGRCAAPLGKGLPDGFLCPACRAAPPAFQGVVALGDYRRGEALADWVLAFKHGGRRDLARPLGARLAAALIARAAQASAAAQATGPPRAEITQERSGTDAPGARVWSGGDTAGGPLLVPVPLHPLRALERGYDQARLLAEAVADGARLELAPVARRVRATPPQGTGRLGRRANVRGVFRLDERAARLVDRAVWLVDDVVASGATVEELARVCRRAGARWIGVAALARSPLPPARSGSTLRA